LNNLQYRKWTQEIDRCSKIYEDFAEAAPFLKAIGERIYMYFEENPVTAQPLVDNDKATDQIRAGRSLELNPALKTEEFVELLKKLSESVAEANAGLQASVDSFKDALNRFLEDAPSEMGKEEAQQLRDSLIKESVLQQDMAVLLFSITLSSFYRQYLQSTAEVLRTDLWEGGNCPLCGERPHFGMLRPADGAKELECWLCGSKWVHTRIKCPFCSNQEQEDLGYFTVENKETCRINFCKQCCQYYKIIDARKFSSDGGDVVLTIHNLATLSYDLLARQEGFTPGSGLEWINTQEIAD